MKINSNTFSFDKTSAEYQALEGVIKKIASDNGITDVAAVQATIRPEDGTVVFKEAISLKELDTTEFGPKIKTRAPSYKKQVEQELKEEDDKMKDWENDPDEFEVKELNQHRKELPELMHTKPKMTL
jgi:hypothetical protein